MSYLQLLDELDWDIESKQRLIALLQGFTERLINAEWEKEQHPNCYH